MKPWNEIKWQAVKPRRRALKIGESFFQWWQAQDAREEKNAAEQIIQAERVAIKQALMVWSDDGGATA